MLSFLEAAVAGRMNIIVSGGTGAGKTTFLNVLSGFISDKERIVTIEDAAELVLRQRHVVRLETRPPNIEGKGDIRQRQLVINALRMRPDRIVVGEVRGDEALDMLQAMNTGHDGSLTTIHANSARDALYRLDTMVAMANLNIPERAIRQQVASAVNLVVHVSRMSDGTRKITCVSELTGMEQEVITMQDIFLFERAGLREDGKVIGRFRATGVRPKCHDQLASIGHVLPMDMFEHEKPSPDSMSPLLLVTVGGFAIIMLVVLGVYWALVVRPESKDKSTLQKRLKVDPDTVMQAGVGKLERKAEAHENSAMDRVLARTSNATGAISLLIEQADVKLSTSGFLLLSVCVGLGTYVLVLLVVGLQLLAVPIGIFAMFIPLFFVRRKRNQRIWKFEEQFPEAIDLIVRALRAGHAFTTGLAMVADEVPAPVGTEFRLLYDRQNYGMPLDEAMKDLANRVPLLDARFFVTAVLMQRETGGNLAEVLDNLTAVIRDRFQVKRQVRVLTAHGRITGWILAGLPPALAIAMFVTAPDNLMMLVNDPLGVQMIVGAVVLQITGTLVIRKLTNIPY